MNIAHADGIEIVRVGPIEIYDPACEADRLWLIEAVELLTSVPTGRYVSGPAAVIILAEGFRNKAKASRASIHRLCRRELQPGSEVLEARVLEKVPSSEQQTVRSRDRFVEIEIGKIRGVVSVLREQPKAFHAHIDV